MTPYSEETSMSEHTESQGNDQTSDKKENYEWIIDEDLLRDEGILYGLSDSDTEEKTDTIRKYYQERISIIETNISLLDEELDATAITLENQRKQITELEKEIETLSTQLPLEPHKFYAILFSFLAYSIMVAFTFWTIYEWLSPHWEYPLLVTVGAYVFGTLNLYHRFFSQLIATEEQQKDLKKRKWLAALEEFGIPFVTTLFIISWGYQEIPVMKVISFALLIYFLLLFAGNGLFGFFIKLPAEFRLIKKNWSKQRFQKKKIRNKKTTLKETNQELGEVAAKVSQIENQKRQFKIEARKLEEECETKIAYFLSEFRLARSTKNSLTSEQLYKLGSYR